MAEFLGDLKRHVTSPVKNFVDDKQKKIRKKAVQILEVPKESSSNYGGGPVGMEQRTNNNSKAAEQIKESGYTLESIRHWDVTMPPVRKHMRGGKMVSTVKNSVVGFKKIFAKKRRITIELYQKSTAQQQAFYKEHDRRVFSKLYSRASTLVEQTVESESDDEESGLPPLGDDDYILFRILKLDKHQPKDKTSGGGAKSILLDWDFDDDDSQETLPNGALESHVLTTYNVKDYGDGQHEIALRWKEHYRTNISCMKVQFFDHKTVEIEYGVGDDTILRNIGFDNPHECDTFLKVFQKMRELQHERGSRMVAEVQRSPEKSIRSLDPGTSPQGGGGFFGTGLFQKKNREMEGVNLLVEIVSAHNLPIADITTSDPYVIVEDGRKEWHRTRVISKSLNPVWTLSTGSLFLIQTSLNDFFEGSFSIKFVIKDYDSVGENDVLGWVLVPKKELLAGDGERKEYEVDTSEYERTNNKYQNKKAFLALRCRKATKDDIRFLKSYESKRRSGILQKMGMSSEVTGVYTEDCYLPPRHVRSKTLRRQERTAEDGMTVQHRLKPFPDPLRPEADTKWMTSQQIERESQKPSREWIEAGSGKVGKFYVEILGCDGLPDLDLGVRNKSDPFVCMAFEDCVVNTDVINDCLSPRWMPWSRRAFVFNVMHPSSQFYISVMDYDEIIPGNPRGNHDKLGRCILNPTNARPNTLYNIRMTLFNSDELDRKVTGKINFRFRFETTDPRGLLLSAFQWRNHFTVSTNRKTDSTTTLYAVTNDYDAYSLSLDTIQKYVDELLEYLDLIDDILDALKIVFLWRGHFPLKIRCLPTPVTIKLPFHSMIAFGWGILLSKDPDRFISFFCFWIAWILFASLEFRRDNPNPWKRPRTYLELVGILLLNRSFGSHIIDANENIEEIMEYDERREERLKFRKEAIERMRVQNELDSKQLEEQNKEVDRQAHDASANMSLGYNQIILAPFREILDPVQMLLYNSVVVTRIVRSIVMWYDSVAAFWIATVALLLSGLVFFIPWSFLFHWTFTILVWTFLGPWMKLVDIFFVENTEHMTLDEQRAMIEAEYKKRYDYLLGESRLRRLIKEHQMKIRAMEKYMFGQHVARVPIFKEERFGSVPLSGGFSVPYDSSKEPPVNIVRRINGQVLTGDMILQREDPARTFRVAMKKKSTTTAVSAQAQTTRKNDDERVPLLSSEAVPSVLEERESSAYGSITEKANDDDDDVAVETKALVKELSFQNNLSLV